MEISLPLAPTPLHASGISTWMTCPRKFLYAERLRLEPHGYKSALARGTAFHALMQYALVAGTLDAHALATKAQHLLTEVGSKMLNDSNYIGLQPDGTDTQTAIKDAEVDIQKALAMVSYLLPKLRDDFGLGTKFKVYVDKDGPFVERRLSDGDAYGTIDLVVQNVETGELWIVDWKTTSMSPQLAGISRSWSPQAYIYRGLLQATLPVVRRNDLRGFIHIIVKSPSIKFTKKDGDLAGYIRRVKDEWYPEQESSGDPPAIVHYNRFSGQVSGEMAQVLSDIEHTDGDSGSADTLGGVAETYPRNSGACFNYNSPCPFLPLCEVDPVLWSSKIDALYTIKKEA